MVTLKAENGVRYTVPQTMDVNNMRDQVVVRFRVADVYRDRSISVYLDGTRVQARKKKVLAPGEMEQVILKKEDLQVSGFKRNRDLYGGGIRWRRELICIGCPLGCPLTVTMEGTEITVTGNTCKRGEIYAKKEVTNPTRVVTSSVHVEGGVIAMVSVKTKDDIPKDKIFACMEEIHQGFCCGTGPHW